MKIHENNYVGFLFFVILGLLSSCHFNSQYLDREEDKNEAEKVSNLLYEDLKNDTITQSTINLFSDKFWTNENSASFKTKIKKTQEKLGRLTEVKLDHWKTQIVVGSNPSAEYILFYLNKYEKYTAMESVSMVKEDDLIKIVRYNINSNGFIK